MAARAQAAHEDEPQPFSWAGFWSRIFEAYGFAEHEYLMRFFPLVDLIMMQAWKPFVSVYDVVQGFTGGDKNGVYEKDDRVTVETNSMSELGRMLTDADYAGTFTRKTKQPGGHAKAARRFE